jgi:hypothetical protein
MKMIRIRDFKQNYMRKFPNSEVSTILRTQPDSVTVDSFFTLAQALLTIIKETKE